MEEGIDTVGKEGIDGRQCQTAGSFRSEAGHPAQAIDVAHHDSRGVRLDDAASPSGSGQDAAGRFGRHSEDPAEIAEGHVAGPPSESRPSCSSSQSRLCSRYPAIFADAPVAVTATWRSRVRHKLAVQVAGQVRGDAEARSATSSLQLVRRGQAELAVGDCLGEAVVRVVEDRLEAEQVAGPEDRRDARTSRDVELLDFNFA